ncbi:MAG: hypothetical protein GXX79_20460 [Actinomycetales bacterium]|nr:hypothetical protein [Actinomycetales bacterium]
MTPVLLTVARAHAQVLAHALRVRRSARSPVGTRGKDAGVSTLEMVIIALGLMAIAALLVAGLTAAVRSRVNQLQ